MKFVIRYLQPCVFWLALALCLCNTLAAQNKKGDSLSLVLAGEKDDTSKVNTLNVLSNKLWGTGKYDTAMACANSALELAVKIRYNKGVANANDNVGIIYGQLGDYPKALEHFFDALKMEEKMGVKNGIARNTGNIGIVYRLQGDYPKALDYFFKALKLYEEMGDKGGIAINTGNIGVIYEVQGDYDKARQYYFKALKMMEGMGSKSGVANNTGNIGNVYEDMASVALSRHDVTGSDSLYNKAVEYYLKALKMYEEISNKHGMARNICGIGEVYTKQKKYRQAKIEFDSALALAESIGEKEDIRDVYSGLAELDSATGNYKEEANDYKTYIRYRDSLINETNTKKSVQTAMNFTFEQKLAAEKAEQDKKDALAEQGKNKQAIIRNSFIAGFVLMFALVFLVFRGYVQKQKDNITITLQKELVEKQKDEVEKQKIFAEHQRKLAEEKNKDILDSLTYAKQLQDAILPPWSLIQKYFPESFVLYKPKDIVAGDFYWMECVGDTVLIAAADCTGHGVPGALVSVVCSNALNRTVKEFHITEPALILDKVRELVVETFEKSERNVQDGMDISLLAISYRPTDAGVEMKWSGAFNPLVYIDNAEIHEIPANRQPIGKTINPKPFTTHRVTLPLPEYNSSRSSTLYLFTDGFADQFGGPKGKKFNYKQLKEKLLTISQHPLPEQKYLLNNEFEAWKGELEQTDDVCIIGIRI